MVTSQSLDLGVPGMCPWPRGGRGACVCVHTEWGAGPTQPISVVRGHAPVPGSPASIRTLALRGLRSPRLLRRLPRAGPCSLWALLAQALHVGRPRSELRDPHNA